jgi:hypothetical protein
MANSFYGANGLTGGGTGALDDINHNNLSDGDGAVVVDAVNDKSYFYTYNSSSSASESVPDVINPDSNSGNGRWILTSVYSDALDANSATIRSLTLASGASVTEFSTDDTMEGDSDTVVPTEQAVKGYVDTFMPVGYFSRPLFVYEDTNTITIKTGMYHHEGTSKQLVYWTSDIEFDFGSAGSNADSDNLSASDWFYLYIDDSAVVTAGTRVLTASEFVAVTTEPSWSDTKLGWYNGNDRCIAAFYSDSGSELLEFYTYGDTHIYGTTIQDRAAADLDDVWEEVSLTIPTFSRKAIVEYRLDDNGENSDCRLRMRPKGMDGSTMRFGFTLLTNDSALGVTSVLTNSNQKIEIVLSVAGAQQYGSRQAGIILGWGYNYGV